MIQQYGVMVEIIVCLTRNNHSVALNSKLEGVRRLKQRRATYQDPSNNIIEPSS